MKVMGFDHVMIPVVNIIKSFGAKAKQHRSSKLILIISLGTRIY